MDLISWLSSLIVSAVSHLTKLAIRPDEQRAV
jgi:hypothetical protein